MRLRYSAALGALAAFLALRGGPPPSADAAALPLRSADAVPLPFRSADAVPLPLRAADVAALLLRAADAAALPLRAADVAALLLPSAAAGAWPLASEASLATALRGARRFVPPPRLALASTSATASSRVTVSGVEPAGRVALTPSWLT